MLQHDGSLRRVAVAHTERAKALLLEELERLYPTPPTANRGPYHVMRTGQPEILATVPDTLLVAAARSTEHLRLLRELGLRSYISVPLRVRNQVRGVLTFVTGESGRIYTTTDLNIAEDLANRASTALENAQLYGELRDADRRKDEFLAILSHELRNPLAPIRSAVEILRLMSPPGREITAARDIIDRQARQMTRIVDDLLDISRITRGTFELRKERVLLSAVIDSAVESSRPAIESGGHSLVLSVPEEPIWLDGDSTRLAQALLNLLNNAAKFTPVGGTISVSAALARLPGKNRFGDVVISVRDTGIGIAADMLHQIFDIFTQGDRTLERSHGGLGVGLTLVRTLVQMHGGTVVAQSDGLGHGSEFVVRLPLARARGAGESETRGDQPAVSVEAPQRRVLVVDDNRDHAESLRTLLEMWGHDVRVAHDGGIAVAEAVAFRPDVALIDIGMPGMSGYDVAKQIRLQAGLDDVVLIAQTGWGQEEHRQLSRAAGFDHHLVKPLSIESLQALIAAPDLPRP
jgi:signal transduction histidine kinase/CheY-like chemotaxis protein